MPPITGLIVIPGNVAFLNQFFVSADRRQRGAGRHDARCCAMTTGTIVLPHRARSHPRHASSTRRRSAAARTHRGHRRSADGSGAADRARRPARHRRRLRIYHAAEDRAKASSWKDGGRLHTLRSRTSKPFLDGLPSGPVQPARACSRRGVRPQSHLLGHAGAPANDSQRRALRPLCDGHQHVAKPSPTW